MQGDMLLHVPTYDTEESVFRIVGIDPGTETLGYAALEVDVKTYDIVGARARTWVGSKLCRERDLVDFREHRQVRLKAHEENLVKCFRADAPYLIASESPFFNRRRPEAYGALTEALAIIREAVWQYNPQKGLYLLPPSVVKRAVGDEGWGDKDKIYQKVSKLTDLCYNGDKPLNQLDEHSIDALAVAYTRWKLFKRTHTNA